MTIKEKMAEALKPKAPKAEPKPVYTNCVVCKGSSTERTCSDKCERESQTTSWIANHC